MMQLVATQAMNVLLRQDVSLHYKAVGAQGRRFFGLGQPILYFKVVSAS